MSNPPDRPRPLSPVQKAGRLLRLLARPALARKLGTLVTEGYLAETGWVRSVCSGTVVDARGEALPWATFAFIDFITPRLQAHWTVFEYGAGASTVFFGRRVATVTAVEHDESFAARLRPGLGPNVHLLLRAAESAGYAGAVGECRVRPDIVCVDGVDRLRCIDAALPAMAVGAVLVLDDAERSEYAPGISRLRAAGFRVVEFWGLSPGWVARKCTSVFYRDANILGL